MNYRYLILILIAISTLFFKEYQEISPLSLPGEKAGLYSPQNGDNLEDTLIYSIQNAKKSIVVLTYTLKSAKIIQALNKAADRGVSVKAIYDAKASSGVDAKLNGKVHAIARGLKGLMHLKFFVIDEHHSWLGSANITRDSLKSHANLVAHLDSPEFAKAILLKANQISGKAYEKPILPQYFKMDDQEIELRFLPDDKTAISRIKDLIRGAKKTIQVAMYTFTREDLADTLIRAHNRGVKVEVIIDASAANSSSKKIYDLLKRNGVNVLAKSTGGLMHHKFMLVDDEILEHGSANWTKAAFQQNDDYIMIISNLSQTQKKSLNLLWNALLQSF